MDNASASLRIASLEAGQASALADQPLTPEDAWLGKPAPRYTSYPPASVFQQETSASYVQALARLPESEPVSLYLHVPFCRTVCLYCGCNTCATQNELRVEAYAETLAHEAKMASLVWPKKRKVSRVHFGGGSPNILTERMVDKLFLALDERFDIGEASEIAMELDPRLITMGQAALLAACGVKRVSLGVQDFHAGVQRAIGRVQPFALVERAVEILRGAGIRQISLDLMYGLPLQTPATVADTARLVLALDPERVSLFSYAHVPSFKKHQTALEKYGLPDPYLSLSMEQAVRAVFREAGYAEIGMDHFAKPTDPLARAAAMGKLKRNFQGYTDDPSKILVGLGASSIGFTGEAYFQNTRDAEPYRAEIEQGRFATVRGLALTAEDKVRARIIEDLMCRFECDLASVCCETGFALGNFEPEMKVMKAYEDLGLVAIDGMKITLTAKHRMAIRVIAQAFDTATRAQAVASSRAM